MVIVTKMFSFSTLSLPRPIVINLGVYVVYIKIKVGIVLRGYLAC